VSYADRTLTCMDCGTEFVHSAEDQEYYTQKGFASEPKRCPSCRAARRSMRGDGDGAGHGNGGNVTHRVDELEMLHDRVGVSVLIFDYRGYGRSEGKPNETGVLADARAARAWLAARENIPETDVVLMGESLGGAVAGGAVQA